MEFVQSFTSFVKLEHAFVFGCSFAVIVFMVLADSWSFMSYFDDHYNYELHKDVFTFYGNPFEQLSKMFHHVGINVYEPVGSLLKGFAITLLGFHPLLLRLVSFSVHILNFMLLVQLIHVLMHNIHSRTARFSYAYVCIAFFLVHPLNAEVIGWLSAQSYTIALSFSLLSCIYLEHMLANEGNEKDSMQYMLMSIACYALSCLSKAPAIMLPAVCMIRILLSGASSKRFSLSLQYLGWMSLVGAVLFTIVIAANTRGTSNALFSEASFVTRFIRAMVIIYSFLGRIVSPQDLRGHYDVIDDGRYSLFYIPSNPSTLLAISTLLTVSLLVVLNAKQYPLMMYSWAAYVIWWVPGCGLVDHGWDQLGADRYNYFPLAFLLPGVVELCDSFFADAPRPKKHKIEPTGNSLYMVLRGATVIVVTATFLCLFTQQLGTWRNDKYLLENCIRMDPNDWTCHEYLGNWHGHHENNETGALLHINKALQLLPPNNVKAQLFKIKTYYNFGHQKEACDLAVVLHDSVDKVSPVYQPYILNNYVLCEAVKNGVTVPYVVKSKPLLRRALQIVNEYKSFPLYVVTGLKEHLSSMEKWKPGMTYEAGLLY